MNVYAKIRWLENRLKARGLNAKLTTAKHSVFNATAYLFIDNDFIFAIDTDFYSNNELEKIIIEVLNDKGYLS